ncbi:MAG: thioredoxin [Saprospiraceae bacterium]|nr:thioredoxin [Saprospiraceae bacterium]
MPMLLNMLKKSTTDLSILFVAFVFNESLVNRTYEKINSYKIPFVNHLNIHSTKNDNLVSHLRVSNYPTYLLLSKEGKIICRTNNLDTLEQKLRKHQLIK